MLPVLFDKVEILCGLIIIQIGNNAKEILVEQMVVITSDDPRNKNIPRRHHIYIIKS